jgi:hypothetical protein
MTSYSGKRGQADQQRFNHKERHGGNGLGAAFLKTEMNRPEMSIHKRILLVYNRLK